MVVVLFVSCILTALMSGGPAQADPPGAQPGLPYLRCLPKPPGTPEGTLDSCNGSDDYVNAGSFLNFPQVGLAGSVKAKQWTQVPLTMVSASVLFYYYDHPGRAQPGDKIAQEWWYEIRAFFNSPRGSRDNYGDSAPIPVRTVAFGSIPVQATLQVSQQRDGAGLPVPLRFRPHDYRVDRGLGSGFTSVVEKSTLSAKVRVRVKKLVVDGVDVGLGQDCSTAGLNDLTLSSKQLEVDTLDDNAPIPELERQFDPTEYQYGIYGGTLRGSIDIGAFAKCSTASGDDISPLLTSALSEADNPVAVRIGATNCQLYDDVGNGGPIPPGVNDPEDPRAGCNPSVAANPRIVTVPKRFDLPDTAPEHTAP